MPESESTPGAVTLPVTFRIARMAYAAPLMMMLTAVILAGTSLTYLGWTMAIPIVVVVWMARLRTTVTGNGLQAVTAFSSREIDWTEVQGLSFPRWNSVRAVCTDGSRVRLPALAFRDLPRLSAASGGRIPNPYAADRGSAVASRVDVDGPGSTDPAE